MFFVNKTNKDEQNEDSRRDTCQTGALSKTYESCNVDIKSQRVRQLMQVSLMDQTAVERRHAFPGAWKGSLPRAWMSALPRTLMSALP